MYFNVFGQRVSRTKYKEMAAAAKNRRELIAAQLSRRDLMKMGLLTGAGYLVSKEGLSARSKFPIPLEQAASPPVTPFIEPLHSLPVKYPVQVLQPAPSVTPLPHEGRTRPHQALNLFPPKKFYKARQHVAPSRVHPQLPQQVLCGFDGMSPGPTYVPRHGEPIFVRNFTALPPYNGGMGLN